MDTYSKYSNASLSDTSFDAAWNELYPRLRLLIRRLVYSFYVPSWHGQENDIVEDILQETARRVIERLQKAERGEVPPIHMLERMVVAIACNYCKDIRRQDWRLIRIAAGAYSSGVHNTNDLDNLDLLEVATEYMYQETLFTLLAREIVKFPDKQRRALLIDLANRMRFEMQPTPLQKAFLNVGIRLQEYQQPLPESAKERSRGAALLYYAYKRIARLACVQQYASVV